MTFYYVPHFSNMAKCTTLLNMHLPLLSHIQTRSQLIHFASGFGNVLDKVLEPQVIRPANRSKDVLSLALAVPIYRSLHKFDDLRVERGY